MESEKSCDNDIIKEVLASIGWQESFLPVGSDKSKKLLDLMKLLASVKVDRIDALQAQEKESKRVGDLVKSANNEINHSQELLTAHSTDYSTESVLFKLSVNDESQFKKLLKETSVDLKEQEKKQENSKRKQQFIKF